MKQPLIVLTALTALAACGGSGTPTTEQPRTADAFDDDITSTSTPSTITVDFSQATNQFTFAADGTGLNGLVREEAQDNGIVLGFQDNNDALFGYAYRSDTGLVAAVGGDDSGFNFRGATFERFGEAEAPQTGAATFTGDYAGMGGQQTPGGNGNDVQYLINGDVTLSADFADNTVVGEITNRTILSENNTPNGFTTEDITLNSTTLDDDLRFTGVATGGAINGGTSSNGSFTGSINGDAEEAIGILTIDQDHNGTDNFEWGIFAVTN